MLRETLTVLVLLQQTTNIVGHGRLVDPPSRASMFRYGYDFGNNRDYNDNQGFCGGKEHQIELGGKCGICGDAWDAEEKPHEAGGIYAKGIIVKSYKGGQSISVKIEVTANHLGYFEFRLCVHNNVNMKATHECFDQNVLQLTDGSGTRYIIDDMVGIKSVDLKLPADVSCTQCILQWKYHVGNSWGADPDGSECLGCGPQEEFYACSDISISSDLSGDSDNVTVPSSDKQKTTTQAPQVTDKPTVIPTTVQTDSSIGNQYCHAIGVFKNNPAYNSWCSVNCALGHCPSYLCSCNDKVNTCKSRGVYKSARHDIWCKTNCQLGYCPRSHCVCNK